MSETAVSATSGTAFGVFNLLGVSFVLGKVFDVQPVGDWSWWWVLAPFWGQVAFIAVLLVILGILTAVVKNLD